MRGLGSKVMGSGAQGLGCFQSKILELGSKIYALPTGSGALHRFRFRA